MLLSPAAKIGTKALCLVLAGLIGLAGSGQAQTSVDTGAPRVGKPYAVDFWIEECRSKGSKSMTAALAVSKTGVWSCGTNRNLRRAESSAVGKCDKLVPREMRKKAACRIVAVDDEIVNANLVALLRQETRMPVQLEIYDGDTQKRQGISGVLVYGESVNADRRKLRVVSSSGATICDGSFVLSKRKVTYDMNCFGRYQFKDQRSKSSKFFLYQGVYTPVFPIELSHNSSTIDIITPN